MKPLPLGQEIWSYVLKCVLNGKCGHFYAWYNNEKLNFAHLKETQIMKLGLSFLLGMMGA